MSCNIAFFFIFPTNNRGAVFLLLADNRLGCSCLSSSPSFTSQKLLPPLMFAHSPFTETRVTDEEDLLHNINELLSRVHIQGKGKHLKSIRRIDELQKSASSMFVAIFEALFHVQLVDIVRHPRSLQDYVANADAVVDAFSLVLNMSLSHIKGEDIVTGDITAIKNLVDVLIGISQVKSSQGGDEEGSQLLNYGTFKQRKKCGTVIAGGKGSNSHGEEKGKAKISSKGTFMQRRMHSSPTAASRVDTMHRRNVPQRKVPNSWPPFVEKEKENLVEPPLDDQSDTDVSRSTHSSSSQRRRDVIVTDSVVQRDGDNSSTDNLPPGPNPDFTPIRASNAQNSKKPARFKDNRSTTAGKLKMFEEEHEKRVERVQAIHKRVLKERMTDLRQREIADEKKQFHAFRNAKHAAKVRKIKQDRMNEHLRLRKASFMMKHENQHGKHILHMYKRILYQMHHQKREDDREDAARLKALYDSYRFQEDNLEQFFIERLQLVTEHQKEIQAERKTALKAEERTLSSLLFTVETAYEDRLRKAMVNLDQTEEALLRAGEEKYYSVAQILGAEDWSTTWNDRFMSARPSAAFELRMKTARKRSNAAQAFTRRQIAQHRLVKAYGQGGPALAR